MRFHLDPRRAIALSLLGLALAWVSLFPATAQEPERFYYYFDKKIPLTVSTEKVGFYFDRDLPAQARRGALDSEAELGDLVSGRFVSGLELVALRPGMDEQRVMAMTRRLAAGAGVRYVSPVFRVGEGELVLTDQVIVKFRPGLSRGEAEAIGALYECELVRISYSKNPEDPHFHLFRAIDPSGDNPLTIANRFHEDRDVLYATPNFQSLSAKLHGLEPDDTWFNPPDSGEVGQWQLYNNAGEPGTEAHEAWQFMADLGISLENTGVVIAVLDMGVDVNHEDINIWVNVDEIPDNGLDDDCNGYVDDINGWNFSVQTNNVTNSNCNGFPPRSREARPESETGDPSTQHPIEYARHGTWVAGVAAAKTNNGIGVAGMAWGARVMALRILDFTGYHVNPGTENPTKPETDLVPVDLVADAIHYAIDNGADVLNNSWGDRTPSSCITDAIRDARFGRDGRGSVVVFSSGNDFATKVNYPANLPEVIGVGMTDDMDEKQFPSNAGPTLDVIAPSGRGSTPEVKLYAPDVQDQPTGTGGTHIGLNSGSPAEPDSAGLYTWKGSGTSGAAPHVSGLGALIINANNNLTAVQVQSIIRFSAEDEVSPNTSQDTAGRDHYMGYGRINANKAVRLAVAPTIMNLTTDEGRHVMSVIEGGHFVLEGNLIINVTSIVPQSSDLLVVWNNADPSAAVARVDALGDLYLKGDLYERVATPPATLSPPSSAPLVLKNRDSTPVIRAFFDGSGNLKIDNNVFLAKSIYDGSFDPEDPETNLIGELNGAPDRSNSQGTDETQMANAS